MMTWCNDKFSSGRHEERYAIIYIHLSWFLDLHWFISKKDMLKTQIGEREEGNNYKKNLTVFKLLYISVGLLEM